MKIAPLIVLTSLPLFPVSGPPGIQVLAPLSFGGLLVPPVGGRVTLTPNGSRFPEAALLLGASPAASHARIHLRGPAKGHFNLVIDPKNPTLKGSAGGSIQVAAFQASLPSLAGRFDDSGETEFTLGGSLDVPAGTPDGVFSTIINIGLMVEGLPGSSQPMTVSCVVRTPLTLTNLSGLDFASVTAGSGGLFVVSPANAFTQHGPGPRLVKGTPRAASFRLTGSPRTPFTIILPGEVLLTGSKGTIRLRDFTSDRDRGILPVDGLVFHVGAGLEVKANQPPGTYNGVFRVTVAYQ